jgi:hypothetical protein
VINIYGFKILTFLLCIYSTSFELSNSISSADGKWPENGPTLTILNELLEIENFLWTNRKESDEVLQPKIWEAIQLSRKISGGKPETNSKNRTSAVSSVTVVYTSLVNCWFIKTSQRNLGQGQRNPWAKSKNSKGKTVELATDPAPLEIANQVEDFVTLVETNILDTISVDKPVDEEIVDEASTENMDVPVTEDQVDDACESDVASEISLEVKTKTEVGIMDYVMVPDTFKSYVNEVNFLRDGRIAKQMEANKKEMEEMEVRLREDYDRKLSEIRQSMLMNESKMSSEYLSETEGANEASKVDKSVTEDVINVSSEVDDRNEKLVDNLQNEIVEAQAEEATIEKPSTPKATEVVVKLKRVTKKRTRNSDSDSEEESKGPLICRSSRRKLTVNYRSLTQGVTINRKLMAYRQQKEEELEAERIYAKKIADEDRERLKKEVQEAKIAMVESEKKAMKSEQKTMGKEVPEEFSASELECPDSPASSEYEDIESKGNDEKTSAESHGSLLELVPLTQKATQPEVDLEMTEIARNATFADIRAKIRNWKNETDESCEGGNTLTIDTDEDIA